MAPTQRKPVPEKLVEPLRAAAELARTALAQRDQLIAAALKAGASTREVGAVVGLDPTQVMRIGHARGWPTEQQRAAWDAVAETARLRRELADAPRDIEHMADLLRRIEESILGQD